MTNKKDERELKENKALRLKLHRQANKELLIAVILTFIVSGVLTYIQVVFPDAKIDGAVPVKSGTHSTSLPYLFIAPALLIVDVAYKRYKAHKIAKKIEQLLR